MKLTICDVCDAKLEDGEDTITMVIPGSFLDNEGGPSMTADICSWDCVARLGPGQDPDALEQREDVVMPRAPKEEPEKFLIVPKAPSVDSEMTPEELATYTERMTGVKRRY